MKLQIIQVVLICAFLLTNTASAQRTASAQPYGGKNELNRFLQNEMQYPVKALQSKINGEVDINVNINNEGKVLKISIKKSTNKIFNTEALRLAKLISWEPALINGKKTTSEISFGIVFDNRKYKNWVRKRKYDRINYPTNTDTSGKIYNIRELDSAPQVIFTDKNQNLFSFFQSQFNYPDDAKRLNLAGVVEVQFVVEPTGHVTNMRAVSTLGGGCTEEALRLLLMLKWKSGTALNKSVRTLVNFPVHFNLSEGGGYITPMAQGTTLFY